MWTSQSLDQVIKLSGASEGAGAAAFVISGTNGGRYSLIGHQGGIIRLVNLESLKVEGSFRLNINVEDEVLTSGAYNPNGLNVTIGTS